MKTDIHDIDDAVCAVFNLDSHTLSSSSRVRKVVRARQTAMYLAREMTGLSLKCVGWYFGGRHYSTVIHALDSIRTKLRETVYVPAEVAAVRAILSAPKAERNESASTSHEAHL